jgi:N-acetyl-gamma-glutamyl-phosphate reductase
MVKVAVIGSTGYTGAELVRILLGHPRVEISALTSESYSGLPFDRVYPALQGRLERSCEPMEVEDVAKKSEVVFTALPHTKAMACVPRLLELGKVVVDLSADFRLREKELYEAWYAPHTAPELLSQAVYGLPELHREEIRSARIVANPGCYPTSAILGVAPLIRQGWVAPHSIIVNSASGVTGAGRSLDLGSLYCEVNEGMKAYKVGEHRHTPEMEQEMSLLARAEVRVTFTPHLVPLSRGILTTVYADLTKGTSDEELLEVYRRFYEGEPFVRILPPGVLPNVRNVRGTNFCDIGLKVDSRTGRVVTLAAIDNLVKGASGQAVQNMNIALGFPETLGLEATALFI